MKVPFLDLKAQYNSIKDEVKKEIDEILDNTAYILGKKVNSFEQRFADAHNSKYCYGVSSGTDGNHLVLWALGLKPGDEVIIPADTFIATVWGATLCGATPVFVDVNPESYNLDAVKVVKAITPKTKAIVAVHLYGQATDIDSIHIEMMNAGFTMKEKGLYLNNSGQEIFLVEDCAQSHLAEYKGKRIGSLSYASSFSFYPGKNLGAYGEGGAVMTDNEEIARRFRMMRDHGAEQKYYHEMLGHNYRMEAIQGAVLGVKMNYIENWTEGRRKAASLYKELLKDCDRIILPKEMDYAKHVYHLFVIQIKDGKEKRDDLMKKLTEVGVATGLHYPIPNHLQPCFKHLGYKVGEIPVTEKLAETGLSLPMFAELNDEQIKYTCKNILNLI